MQLHSAEFAAFVIAASAASWLLRNRTTLRCAALLFMSYLFFVRWNLLHPARQLFPDRFSAVEVAIVCISLIMFSSSMDYFVGRRLFIETRPRRRKMLLAASVVLNLGILSTFKYAGFFTSELMPLFGFEARRAFDFFAPLGISFYTFQTISYVVDVYRRKTAPADRYLDYLLYLAFFPKLAMGPIARADDLLPKLKSPPRLTDEEGGEAFFRIGMGLVKKLALADLLRGQIVDPVFTNPEMYSSLETLAAVYSYSFQIYLDFSGYTDIAVGAALLMGVRIPENFRAPYRARSLSEFWRRWHITLSTWLRDYLYIPLGGSRCAKWRIYLNLMITMLLGGLWHGPALTFIAWGGIHGALLAVTRFVERADLFASIPEGWRRALGPLITFHLVTAAWIFFRAPSMDASIDVLSSIASLDFGVDNLPWCVPVALVVAAVSHFVPDRRRSWLLSAFNRLPSYVQAALLIGAALAAEKIGSSGVSPFIYSSF